MTYYRIFTVEHTGLNDTTTVKADRTIGEAKSDYIALRFVQSQKGFKKPMPKEVTIQYGY